MSLSAFRSMVGTSVATVSNDLSRPVGPIGTGSSSAKCAGGAQAALIAVR